MSETGWQSMDTAPHNTNVLVLTKCGAIDVANDHFDPARWIKNSSGVLWWSEARSWWSNPYTSGYESEWDFSFDDLIAWMPLPEPPNPPSVLPSQTEQ